MALKKVFVSYDHSEDDGYRKLLRLWAPSTQFDFDFDMRSPTVRIDSDEAHVVQAALTQKMKEADCILVLIGEKSSTSTWMRWEIDRAQAPDVALPLAAIQVTRNYKLPANLPANAVIGIGFTMDRIEMLLNRAIAASS